MIKKDEIEQIAFLSGVSSSDVEMNDISDIMVSLDSEDPDVFKSAIIRLYYEYLDKKEFFYFVIKDDLKLLNVLCVSVFLDSDLIEIVLNFLTWMVRHKEFNMEMIVHSNIFNVVYCVLYGEINGIKVNFRNVLCLFDVLNELCIKYKNCKIQLNSFTLFLEKVLEKVLDILSYFSLTVNQGREREPLDDLMYDFGENVDVNSSNREALVKPSLDYVFNFLNNDDFQSSRFNIESINYLLIFICFKDSIDESFNHEINIVSLDHTIDLYYSYENIIDAYMDSACFERIVSLVTDGSHRRGWSLLVDLSLPNKNFLSKFRRSGEGRDFYDFVLSIVSDIDDDKFDDVVIMSILYILRNLLTDDNDKNVDDFFEKLINSDISYLLHFMEKGSLNLKECTAVFFVYWLGRLGYEEIYDLLKNYPSLPSVFLNLLNSQNYSLIEPSLDVLGKFVGVLRQFQNINFLVHICKQISEESYDTLKELHGDSTRMYLDISYLINTVDEFLVFRKFGTVKN